MRQRFRSLTPDTQLQYALMGVFGLAAIAVALAAPVSDQLRIAGTAITFGITVGLWLAHLIQVFYTASEATADPAG